MGPPPPPRRPRLCFAGGRGGEEEETVMVVVVLFAVGECAHFLPCFFVPSPPPNLPFIVVSGIRG